MIWRDDDKRDEQQKKLEYARELEQQIELRKALEREEKEQQEEWERRFVEPRDAQSPAKWWTELRASEPPARATRLGFHMDASALPYADPATENGVSSVTTATPSRQRFHATLGDPLASHDRLRVKAQQLEWKRLLDEQTRENDRRKQHEIEQQKLRERDEAEEDMRIQREQQLRAQRKLGIHDFAPTTAFSPQNYVAIPSPPAPPQHHDPLSMDDRHHGYSARNSIVGVLPPAPVQARTNDSVDFQFRRAMGLHDTTTQPQPQPHYEPARDRVADEYRALLVEIRREREDLRRERDELRREKEELRMERALMQMENEKMATLLESQRHMTDQRLESIARLDRALETRAAPVVEVTEPITPRYARQQSNTPRPTRLPSPLHIVHRTHGIQQLHSSTKRQQQQQPLQQPSPSPVHLRQGAMSMADFASPTHARSPSARAIEVLHARRHERFRLYEQENPLERSLHGDSEFVALSPRATTADRRYYDAAPRIMETRSPSASMMDPRRERANPLRSSRAIKSRGYYDFNRDDAQPQSENQMQSPRQSRQQHRTLVDHHSPLQTRGDHRDAAADESDHSEKEEEGAALQRTRRWSAYSEEDSHDDDHDENDIEEEEDDDSYPILGDNLLSDSQTGSELSRSLFQVQVLVNEQ